MSRKTIKGAIGEHKVIIQLLEDGYHVAKAIDPQCPFDLISVDEEGNCIKYYVKTISHRKNTPPTWPKKSTKIKRVTSQLQKKLGIELREVD